MSTAITDIPKGYKQTKVGVIPEDWEVKKLGSLCKIVSGGTPSTQISAYWDGLIPWCTPTDITQNSDKYLYDTERNISDLGLQNSSASLLPPGTLLLCTRATIGEIKIASTSIATNQGFKSLICHENTNNHFLYYKICNIKNELIMKGVGSTFLEISKNDVENLQITTPPLKEQKTITNSLSDVDTFIKSLEQLIAKKRDLKQGAMQELLTGKTRLLGFSGEWVKRKFKNVTTQILPGASPRPIADPKWFDINSSIGWVRISDVTKSTKFLLNTRQKLSQEGIQKSRFVPSGSLIMSKSATVGYPIQTCIDVCIHDGFIVFEKPLIHQDFLYYLLKYMEPNWSEKGQTGSQMNLNTNLIKKTDIVIPSTKAEQQAIANILSDMDAEITALEKRRDKLMDLKQGMMQQLLTGRIRLVEASA